MKPEAAILLVITFVVEWTTRIVSLALLLLIAASVAGKYGVRVPMLPQTDATALAWLAGAWWLYRGGKV